MTWKISNKFLVVVKNLVFYTSILFVILVLTLRVAGCKVLEDGGINAISIGVVFSIIFYILITIRLIFRRVRIKKKVKDIIERNGELVGFIFGIFGRGEVSYFKLFSGYKSTLNEVMLEIKKIKGITPDDEGITENDGVFEIYYFY